jgi:hypothetical protein
VSYSCSQRETARCASEEVPEKDWLPFLKYVKHAPDINPEEGKDYP